MLSTKVILLQILLRSLKKVYLSVSEANQSIFLYNFCPFILIILRARIDIALLRYIYDNWVKGLLWYRYKLVSKYMFIGDSTWDLRVESDITIDLYVQRFHCTKEDNEVVSLNI